MGRIIILYKFSVIGSSSSAGSEDDHNPGVVGIGTREWRLFLIGISLHFDWILPLIGSAATLLPTSTNSGISGLVAQPVVLVA